MMLSDVCLSVAYNRWAGGVCGQPADGAYWLIGPGLAGLAQGCRCALPLQAWAGVYHGSRLPTARFEYKNTQSASTTNQLTHTRTRKINRYLYMQGPVHRVVFNPCFLEPKNPSNPRICQYRKPGFNMV